MRIAVVEDDSLVREGFGLLLKGHDVEWFVDALEFVRRLPTTRGGGAGFDLILLDLRSANDPEGSFSLGAIAEIRRSVPEAELVIQSGVSDVATMRACVRNGASRFLLKEHLGDEVPSILARLAELRGLRETLRAELVGESPVMLALRRELAALRFENVDVLVEGETGSGKELCARALHGGGPLVALNVSAIPPDLFEAEFFGAEKGAYTGAQQTRIGALESAGHGTLFLDEIQSLAPAHQAKLLRVLEARRYTRVGSTTERPFRARVVSASNVNLREAVQKGAFREDLYYRLAPVTIHVPPLRVRGEDVARLAKAFLAELDPKGTKSFTAEALAYLQHSYDWPGNVRELKGLVRGLLIRSRIPKIDAEEIAEALAAEEGATPVSVPSGSSATGFAPDWTQGFDANVAAFEKFLLEAALRGITTTEAREKLRLPRSRFYEKLKVYGLRGADKADK